MQIILFIQSAYYLLIGLWLIVNNAGFYSDKARSPDLLPLKTCGLLIATTGLTLFFAAAFGLNNPTHAFLSACTAYALYSIDACCIFSRPQRKIHITDAIIQLSFFIGIIAAESAK